MKKLTVIKKVSNLGTELTRELAKKITGGYDDEFINCSDQACGNCYSNCKCDSRLTGCVSKNS